MTGKEYLDLQKNNFNRNKNNIKLITSSLESIIKAESQGCLFHGSPSVKKYNELLTHETRLDNKKVVFAGKLWMALSFLVEWTDKDIDQGTVNGKPYMNIKNNSILDLYKQGGWIYQLSPEYFEHTDRLTSFEFISYRNIKPIASVFIKDPISYMKALGVKISIKNNKPISTYW